MTEPAAVRMINIELFVLANKTSGTAVWDAALNHLCLII